MQVHYHLSNIKKADMTATAYYHKMKGYADTMASLGHPLTDEEILDYILAGLGAEYESLITSITTRDEPIILTSFFVHLLSAKVHIQRNTSAPEIQSSANAASRQFTDNHGGGHRGPGCGRGVPGHGGGGHGRGGPKPTCQVCNKYGHDALHCCQRFNHAYQSDENCERTGTPPPTLRNMWTPIGILTAAPMIISLVNSIV
jgi:hypothetical protein